MQRTLSLVPGEVQRPKAPSRDGEYRGSRGRERLQAPLAWLCSPRQPRIMIQMVAGQSPVAPRPLPRRHSGRTEAVDDPLSSVTACGTRPAVGMEPRRQRAPGAPAGGADMSAVGAVRTAGIADSTRQSGDARISPRQERSTTGVQGSGGRGQGGGVPAHAGTAAPGLEASMRSTVRPALPSRRRATRRPGRAARGPRAVVAAPDRRPLAALAAAPGPRAVQAAAGPRRANGSSQPRTVGGCYGLERAGATCTDGRTVPRVPARRP